MTIRRQTLEEWFLQHQLSALARNHFHLPFDLEIDLSALAEQYAKQSLRVPITAVVVKAAGIVAREHPEINRAVLSTPLGTRVVQFEEVHVNLPVLLSHPGGEHLSATVIRHADRKSVTEIAEDIRAARQRSPDALPVARRLIHGQNTLRHRTALRLRHWAAFSIPSVYARFGGGISVSSLTRPQARGVLVRVPSYGPTALTLCPGSLGVDQGRTMLRMGVGYDHFALSGIQAVRALERLGHVLTTGASGLGPDDAPSKPGSVEPQRR